MLRSPNLTKRIERQTAPHPSSPHVSDRISQRELKEAVSRLDVRQVAKVVNLTKRIESLPQPAPLPPESSGISQRELKASREGVARNSGIRASESHKEN